MLFNSYIFIFLFFPCVLAGYFGLNHFGKYTAANLFLVGMSLWFYGYYNPKYLFVIVGSILVNYALSRAMLTAAPRAKKALLAAGVTANVACIFVFKYYDFFTSSINSAFHTSFTLLHIALPLGISFYTFQQIAYLVDSYRGKTKDYTFIEYALFVVFFPQLIAGPIVQHQEMIPQFRDVSRRKWNGEKFAYGLYIFALGLFKKVLLADTFATLVTKGYANIATLTCVEAILVSLAYTFQLYFDFSGYCDMAIGIGSMMNIELAHDADPLPAGVHLHPTGRQPEGKAAHIRQYYGRIPRQRPVARRELDVCAVGRTARRGKLHQPRRPPRVAKGLEADPLAGDVLDGECAVGVFPR